MYLYILCIFLFSLLQPCMNKYDCNEKNIIDNAFVQIKNVHIVVTLLLIDNNILQ